MKFKLIITAIHTPVYTPSIPPRLENQVGKQVIWCSKMDSRAINDLVYFNLLNQRMLNSQSFLIKDYAYLTR